MPSRLRAALAAMLTYVVIVGVGGLAPSANAGAPPVPKPAKAFASPPEQPARYVGQVSCEAGPQPGTAALRQLLLDTYGQASIGTLRTCSTGGRSEHKDGRALDWMLDVGDATEKARAEAYLAWLLGPDAKGVSAGNAHRLGVMYVIWNRRTWQSWTGAWKPYTGSSPHTDHIHTSLGWNGAMKRTSWWTGKTAAGDDFGPCQIREGVPAPRYTGPRSTPCPSLVPVPQPVRPVPRPRSIALACPSATLPRSTFADVPASSPFTTAVSCLAAWGVAQGQSPVRYAPDEAVTREEMAAFVVRLVVVAGGTLPQAPADAFVDDESSAYETEIDQLAAARVVAGRGGGTYGPRDLVLRSEMAAYLVRAHDLLARQHGRASLVAGADYFGDDDSSGLESAIGRAAAAGLVVGYGGAIYRPDTSVRRDHMAAFLSRLLDLGVAVTGADRP